MRKIFVVVNNGEAKVQGDTVPADVAVEVIDLDVIRLGQSFPSREALQYCRDHRLVEERRVRPRHHLSVVA